MSCARAPERPPRGCGLLEFEPSAHIGVCSNNCGSEAVFATAFKVHGQASQWDSQQGAESALVPHTSAVDLSKYVSMSFTTDIKMDVHDSLVVGLEASSWGTVALGNV
jgi:hypothetical protein